MPAPATAHSSATRRSRGRYAPSPSGTLHLGNLRTALLAWLCARAAGGAFILRVEDLDVPRTRPGSATQLFTDLRWLGITWDEGPDCGGRYGPYTQSMRAALYAAALARLRARDLVYPCYCSRAELRDASQIASAPHGGDDAPRYPGTCRTLSARERQRREAEGRRPALRFRVPDTAITYFDGLAGQCSERVSETVGDFVVRRSDGIIAYQLAVVVDDALMDITQIVRGADLLPSTARQLALYDALGYPRPTEYLHVPLVLDGTGARLAKRDASAGVAALRAAGRSAPEVLGALAASSGFWPPDTPASPSDLLAAFTPARISPGPTVLIL